MPKYYSQFDFSGIPLKNVVLHSGPTAPASPVTDQLWTDTSASPHLVKIYDGSTWSAVGFVPDGSITTAKLADGAVTDAKLAGSIALSKLATDPLARGNHTGTQTASTISDFDTTVRAYSLSDFAALTGDLNLHGSKLTNLGNPTAASDAANKSYVDSARAGISVKDPVRVVAPGNVDLASPGVIDGVTLTDGQRFLAPDQSNAADNGIYEWHSTGATRAYDAQVGDVEDGTIVAVAEGAAAGEQWIQTAGSGNQVWTVFSMGGQTYTASAPLSISGNNITLGTLAVANGGTGATTPEVARDNLKAAGAWGETVTGLTGSGATVTVTHNLDTPYVGVFTILSSTGERVDLDWKRTGNNAVELTSEVALPGSVDVTVVGF